MNTGSLCEWVPRCLGLLQQLVVVVQQVTLGTVSSEVAWWLHQPRVRHSWLSGHIVSGARQTKAS